MVLTGGGFTIRAGDGIGNLMDDGPSPPLFMYSLYTPGAVHEQAGNNLLADSFFDVFVEIDVPGVPFPLHNTTPLRMSAVIVRIPPYGSTYTSSVLPVSLYDPTGQMELARLVEGPGGAPESHRIIPEPAALGLIGVALLALRKRRS